MYNCALGKDEAWSRTAGWEEVNPHISATGGDISRIEIILKRRVAKIDNFDGGWIEVPDTVMISNQIEKYKYGLISRLRNQDKIFMLFYLSSPFAISDLFTLVSNATLYMSVVHRVRVGF